MTKNDVLLNSKIFTLLCKFDKKELKDFGLWLLSPIHNKSEKVIKLYEFIKKYKDNCSKMNERVLLRDVGIIPSASKRQTISPKDIKELRQVMHSLRVQADDFLAWRRLQQDNTEKKGLIMDTLLERTAYGLIRPMLNKAKAKHEASAIQDVKYCEGIFRLTEMEFYLEILQKNHNTQKAQETIDTLRQAFISKLLKYYCSLLNLEKVNKKKYEYPLLAYIKQHLDNHHADRSVPIIYVYYALLKLIEDEKPEDYYKVKDYLFKHPYTFGEVYNRQFFNILTNYCNRKIKNGEDDFMQERFEIYKKGVELKCWSAGTYFSEHQFIHIVKTALFLGELDWLEVFFQEHKDLLNPNVKDVFVNYYHALVTFESREYDTAQNHLREINNDQDFVYYMQSRILLIKIYYDNNELNSNNADEHPINNELEAIRQYALPSTNKKMSETVRQQYSNFANFFKRILHRKKKLIDAYEKSPTQANLQALQKDLTHLKPLIERTWLEEKVTELMAALE